MVQLKHSVQAASPALEVEDEELFRYRDTEAFVRDCDLSPVPTERLKKVSLVECKLSPMPERMSEASIADDHEVSPMPERFTYGALRTPITASDMDDHGPIRTAERSSVRRKWVGIVGLVAVVGAVATVGAIYLQSDEEESSVPVAQSLLKLDSNGEAAGDASRWCVVWDYAEDNKAEWFDGHNKPVTVDSPKGDEALFTLTPESGNGLPDVHIKKPFSGRKAFFIEADWGTSTSMGSVWLLHESTTNCPNGICTQFGKNAWPSTGEIDIFQTLESYPDTPNWQDHVYSWSAQQCSVSLQSFPWHRFGVPRSRGLRYLVIVDQLEKGGQYWQIVLDPKVEGSSTCFDIKQARGWSDFSSAASNLEWPNSKYIVMNNGTLHWGSNKEGDCWRKAPVAPDYDKLNLGLLDEQPCGYPFFGGFNWHLKATQGSLKVKTMKVFQPVTGKDQCF